MNAATSITSRRRNARLPGQSLLSLLPAVSLVLYAAPSARAGGVTLITHGFNSDVTSWIMPMAGAMTRYANYPGTNSSCYIISITQSNSQYVFTQSFVAGTNPVASDTAEIFIKLDWSTLSGFGGPATTTIANSAAAALLSTNLIPELRGHALAELPLHLVGHSRGGSVITEMARILGAQGIWVDQVTTLDPDPVSSFGDPALKNYANILFADNYWQNMGDGLFVPNGQAVPGAYNRQLTNLAGGYSSSHSDVHLWYHGTVDFTTPITVDSATISNAERTNWWTSAEQKGTNAGFRWSLIGGGDRLSTNEPAGAGKGRIRDGFRDLAVAVPTNRIALPANNGAWPNVILLNLGDTNPAPAGQAIPFTLTYQSGSNQNASAALNVFLDADLNPYDTNEISVLQTGIPDTGTNSIVATNLNFQTDPARVAPGAYRLFARISENNHSRYLYAPGWLTLTASVLPPWLTSLGLTNGQFHLRVGGYTGQRVVVEASINLATWTPIATNTLSAGSAEIADALAAGLTQRFYRAVLKP
jgi:hypothetical protein